MVMFAQPIQGLTIPVKWKHQVSPSKESTGMTSRRDQPVLKLNSKAKGTRSTISIPPLIIWCQNIMPSSRVVSWLNASCKLWLMPIGGIVHTALVHHVNKKKPSLLQLHFGTLHKRTNVWICGQWWTSRSSNFAAQTCGKPLQKANFHEEAIFPEELMFEKVSSFQKWTSGKWTTNWAG